MVFSVLCPLSSVLWALLLPGVALRADEPTLPGRVPAAKLVSESGSLFAREIILKPWKVVKQNEEVMSGDLLVGGLDTALESINGAISLKVSGDQADKEPFPVLETALVLNPPKGVDCDFTLERGRIRVTNTKKSGAAKVRITIRGRPTEYELPEPGDGFLVSIYGRWPAGTPFKLDDKEGPPIAVVFLALKGEIHVKGPRVDTVMKAPPGVALFISDNLDHAMPEPPQYLDRLPEWAEEGNPSDDVKKRKEALARFRKAVLDKTGTDKERIGEVLDEFVKSENPYDRRLAVLMMGALDDLPRLADTLVAARYPDVWDFGVIALRHWIGRGPGQDKLLYGGLILKGKFKPTQAEAILTMLHSFGEEDLNTPETYEVLIDYLESDRLSIRGLAYWHLSRLVPQGKKFGFDPFGEKDKREAAVAEWRKLIPPGKLPPKPKPEDLVPKKDEK